MGSNRVIIVNSAILYIRLAIVSICGIFTTRYSLQALGVDDFGLFSVVGGIVSFIAIVNTIMLSTSNRFIAVAIGKNCPVEINQTFNANLIIHIGIAVVTMLIAFPIGHWYIYSYINYSGDISNVITVFELTIVGSVISFIGVPYNGLLLAKEKFLVFCLTDVLSSVLRLVFSYLLIYYFTDKLFVYALIISITTAYPTIVFLFYCKKMFGSLVKFTIVKNKRLYRDIFDFSIWVGFGAVTTILKAQGSALIINTFFNTVMNTALGVANSVNSILLTFSNNVHKSIAPQIVKSYSCANENRCTMLVVLSSKVSYIIMLFVSTPFILCPDFIFNLWLGSIPPYVIPFTILIIIDTLITSLNAGIPDLVFATGKVRAYQIIVNCISSASVVVGYCALKMGAPAGSLLICYIIFSIIVFFVRQIVLNKIVKFDNRALVVGSYLPSLLITALFSPVLLLKNSFGIVPYMTLSLSYLILLIILFGLNKREKQYIVNVFKQFKKRRYDKESD